MTNRFIRLELQGFKSFAEREILDMDDRLIGIVGPNGSGKSNVVDALRWVLGERRAAELRGDGAQHLIFAGNGKRGRASLARVTAVFRNDDGVFPLDSAEISVERRVARDGESQVMLNGKEVKLADIEEFLARARLGPRSFAIVGQGDADLFVRATPDERRLLIEEMLGLNEFRIKKKRAERRLKQARVHMEQVSAQLAEIEPHLSFLRREVRKWERRDAIKGTLASVCGAYFGSQLRALHEERSAAEAAVAEEETASVAREEHIRSLTETVSRAESALNAYSPKRGSGKEDVKQAVKAFLADMREALQHDAALLAHRVREWVRKFEELVGETEPEAGTPPIDAFKQAVASLEDARQAARDTERVLQEARFGLERVRMKEEELKREAEAADFDLSAAREADAWIDMDDARAKIRRMQAQLAAVGEVDEAMLAEAQETETRSTFLSKELQDLRVSSDNLTKLIQDLDARVHHDFSKAFQRINESFNAYFRTMFGGGSAKMALVRAEGVDEEQSSGEMVQGVALELDMPGKRLHSVEALSGGERSLVSLAALFALISVSPPPFLVMDEIDAALDESNAVRFAELIQKFSAAAQFIVVTHNRITIESLHTLYGVTMGDDGVSKVLSMRV